MNEEQKRVSDCCEAEIHVFWKDGMTNDFYCMECRNPCTLVARATTEPKSFNYDRTKDPDPEFSKPMDSSREADFDLDKFFAGAKRAGDILDEKEKSAQEKQEGGYNRDCLNCQANGQGCAVHYKSLAPSKPSEPTKKEWEGLGELVRDLTAAGAVNSKSYVRRRISEWATEVERKAEERGKQSMKDMGNTWEDGYEEGKLLATVSARIEEKKRIVESIHEFRHEVRNLSVSDEFDIAFDNFIVRLTLPDRQ